MIGLIARVTLRELLGQRRMLILVLLALVPVLVGLIFRLGGQEEDRGDFAAALFRGVSVAGILPVIAVVVGTSVLGSEFEDSTAAFLLAKPVSRAAIVAGKLVAAIAVISVLVVPASVAGVVLGVGGLGEDRIVPAFAIAILCGAVAYASLFVALSVFTSHALMAGLAYVFLWEGAIASLFTGTRVFSVRQYTLGIADGLATVRSRDIGAQLSPVVAISGWALALALSFAAATWLLQRWEAREAP